MERINLFWKEYGVLVVVGLAGAGSLIYGLGVQLWQQKPVVEIVRSDTVLECHGGECGRQTIYVDVAGAVERPGVYKLQAGSRIGDAVIVAGGLSVAADREWVGETLNLAKEIKDGEKVYIPRHSENVGYSDNQKTQNAGLSENRINQRVNINTASLAELDKLTGIGPSRAQAIVDNRPYASSEELVVKAKIPASVYEKIQELVSVY